MSPVLLLVLILGACAPQATPAPQAAAPAAAPRPAPPAAVALAPASIRPAWQEKWETALAAAKKEGTVVIATSGGSQLRAAISSGIKEAHGLKAENIAGTAPEVQVRVFAERRAGLYLEDVYVASPNNLVNELKPSGVLDPIDSALILPEVTDRQVWYGGDLPWVDKEHMVIAFSFFPGRAIAINTNLVKPDEIKSWRDLSDPKWKGKVALNDPGIPSAGQLVLLFMDLTMGWDSVKELAKAEPIIIRDQRQQLDWLAHGKIAILIGPKPEVYVEFLKAGAPVATVEPAEGTWLSCGVAAVTMFNKAPHPNAATVFLNWLLSKDGQTVFASAAQQQSGRLDVPTTGLTPDSIRQPGKKYTVAYDEPALARWVVTAKMGKELFASFARK